VYDRGVGLLVFGFLFSPMFAAAGILLWGAGAWVYGIWQRHRHPAFDVRLLPHRSDSVADEAERWLRAR
jgi:hypothetical protein